MAGYNSQHQTRDCVADSAVQFTPAKVFELNGPSFDGWLGLMRDHLELRDCWDVVDFALSHREEVEEMLQHKEWARRNLLAKIHIKHNISRADLNAVSTYDVAGDIWLHLFKKYKDYGSHHAITNVTDWKMEPWMTVVEAFSDLEQKNEEILQLTPDMAFSEPMLIAFFLEKVPYDYRCLRTKLRPDNRNRTSLLQALRHREEELKATPRNSEFHPKPASVFKAPSIASRPPKPLKPSKASKHSKPPKPASPVRTRATSPATNNSRNKAPSVCHNCGKLGHRQRFCPEKSHGTPNGTDFNTRCPSARQDATREAEAANGSWDAYHGSPTTAADTQW